MTAQIAAYGRLVADPQTKTTSKGTNMAMARMRPECATPDNEYLNRGIQMTKDAINDAPAAQSAQTKRIRPEGLSRAQWKKRKRVQKITEFWPKLFDINNPKPLKLNIMQDMAKDIQARGLDMGIGSVRVSGKDSAP